jgi:hypothetical protein
MLYLQFHERARLERNCWQLRHFDVGIHYLQLSDASASLQQFKNDFEPNETSEFVNPN